MKSKQSFKKTMKGLIKRSLRHMPRIIHKQLSKGELIDLYLKLLENLLNRDELLRVYLEEAASLMEPEERFLIPSIQLGYGKENDRFLYQQRFIDFDIKPGEKVLDIGSGGYPFPMATHLADLYEGETSHRHEPLIKDGRPLIICDICDLPFEDKEFDFIYCSHVLEHVEDPGKACEEIMRVGKRGYIETPTRMSDITLNFTKFQNHHKWHICLLENTLIFMEWRDGEQRDTGVDTLFLMMHSKYKNPFQDLVHNNRDLFANMMLWQDRFSYFVFDKKGMLIQSG
ncbi:MAG: class I SAM-dependent methyltransferase [Paenibacillus sp.]|nr:class I SAM-dependent methyltransferase [Paenibacillus sp.]